MTIHFTIPGLKTVSEANVREHWRVKAHRARQIRSSVGIAMMLHAKVLRTMTAPYSIHIVRASSGKLDRWDNLPRSAKSVLDTICKYLGVDDGDEKAIQSVTYGQRPLPRGQYAIDITITGTTKAV